MPDIAIVNPAITPEPKDYTLTGTQQLLLKSVRAVIDGSGAAGAYLPTLQMLAPDGTVMWESVPSTTVAAGGSADVSWFRGVTSPANWPNTNQSDTVLAFGPWAFWKLNEPNLSVTAADSSGHGRTLTVDTGHISGGNTPIVPTSSDTSMYVPWQSASNVFPLSSAAVQTWTQPVGSWEFWLNTPGHSPNELNLGCLGDVSGATTRLFRFYLNAALQPVFEFQDTGNVLHTLTTAAGITNNTTYQLVYVLDGTNLNVYLNGALAQSQAQGATMLSPFTNTVYLTQPAGGAGSRSWAGFLEHVAWYDKALAATDVANIYAAGTVV